MLPPRLIVLVSLLLPTSAAAADLDAKEARRLADRIDGLLRSS